MSDLANREKARVPEDLAQLLIARANSGDAEGMAALYEPNATLAIGGGRFAVGREAIVKFYRELVSKGQKFVLGDQRPAIVQGDLALTSSHLPNGTVTAEIAHRQADGTWLWVIDQPAISA